jgi:hypothetical protein
VGSLDQSDVIFGDAKVTKIAEIISIEPGSPEFVALWDALSALGMKWRKAIQSAPVDFPISADRPAPSKRIRWLENNVEKPARALRECLEIANDPYFSAWGSYAPEGLNFDREPVRQELASLIEYMDSLILDLHRQKNEKAHQTAEMRYDIVWDIVQCFNQHKSDKTPRTLGAYYRDVEGQTSPVEAFVGAVFAVITGGPPDAKKKFYSLLRIALKD